MRWQQGTVKSRHSQRNEIKRQTAHADPEYTEVQGLRVSASRQRCFSSARIHTTLEGPCCSMCRNTTLY